MIAAHVLNLFEGNGSFYGKKTQVLCMIFWLPSEEL